MPYIHIANQKATKPKESWLQSDAEIVRVGVFTAVTENFFLKFVPETQSLQVLARQPARRFRSMADDLFELDEGYTAMAVDPSKGQILGLLIQTPGIGERINQGGLPGYIIILIGLLGLAMSLWRMKYLKEEDGRMINQNFKFVSFEKVISNLLDK